MLVIYMQPERAITQLFYTVVWLDEVVTEYSSLREIKNIEIKFFP